MYIAILGRQPEISLAEIRAQFGNGRRIAERVAEFDLTKADVEVLRSSGILTEAGEPNIDRFGGVLKFAKPLEISPLEFLTNLPEGKITLGVSDFSRRSSARRAQMEAMRLKRQMKKRGRSVRALPNSIPEIVPAVDCEEKLGRRPLRIELIVIEADWFISVGAYNIKAYAGRDQARPARDAKVGMLPPKLAQVLVNLCGPLPVNARILDPFCGTGVVLQEARLMNYQIYGTDASERMVSFARRNMEWLDNWAKTTEDFRANAKYDVEVGDATNFQWKQPIDAVAAEVYLGPPMSEAPAEIKLKDAKQECGEILRGFLKNLSGQIKANTPVVLAIPAWLRPNGAYERLAIDPTEFGFRMIVHDGADYGMANFGRKSLDEKRKMGYNGSNKLGGSRLLYARSDQVVAREIIVLRKN